MDWHPHSTVAYIVERDVIFLMVKEKDQNQTIFTQPAGHLDENKTLYTAMLSETREETAWEVKLDACIRPKLPAFSY
ncbi:MAG: NUDIX domain-containing protein [Pseudohongiellaceae bacterium]